MENLYDELRAVDNAIEKNNLVEANQLIRILDFKISAMSEEVEITNLYGNLGAFWIDIGNLEKDAIKIQKGIQYTTTAISRYPKEHLPLLYHNLANGYHDLWELCLVQSFNEGRLDESYQKAKDFYRKALSSTTSEFITKNRQLYNQLIVDYANCLDSVNRRFEAVSLYDVALGYDPQMGMALGNKGITLINSAPLSRGYIHIFYLEAHRLLTEAMKQPLHDKAKMVFSHYLEDVNRIIDHHRGMKPEKIISSRPKNKFHSFLRQFCLQNDLFLTPITLIGKDKNFIAGDPMFISKLVASLNDEGRINKFITYLNQIKQDYVLARYMLAQSQYKSGFLEAVDNDVTLYYPLDYSLNSSYIQMLKTSYRLAVDVLDKIAFFIKDYYAINIDDEKVYFRNIFTSNSEPNKLRSGFSCNNRYLFALYDLAIDLEKKEGYYKILYNRRNELTHRMLVIHDMILEDNKTGDSIPRVYLDEFIKECIQAMQIARNAVVYLIFMVDLEEKQNEKVEVSFPIYGTPVNDAIRWVPPKSRIR
jgi:hypothetical protein